jgi:hypothetical protein
MGKGRVVVGASGLALLAACSTTQTTTPAVDEFAAPRGTVTSCARDSEGFVRVGGVVQNLQDVPQRVEITVAVVDTSTNKQVDYTQAKSSVLQPGKSESYTAAVYSLDGKNSVPLAIPIKCVITNVIATDPNEVG